MNLYCLLFLLLVSLSCNPPVEEKQYLFYFHSRFLETHTLEEAHPEYGKDAYPAVIERFKAAGLEVISELRPGNVNALHYAESMLPKIDSLLKEGVAPHQITIAGASKGGYIAQYVSSLSNNSALNFVFIACFRDEDMVTDSDINFCGNILTIYDTSDQYGVSAMARKEASTCANPHFKEVELSTGLKHGFIYQPLDEWIVPTIQWAKGNYALK